MVVPATVIQVNKSGTPFGQSPCQQAVIRITARTGFSTIHLQCLPGFPGKIHQFGDRGLHLEGHFIGGNSSVDFRIGDTFISIAIQFLDSFNQLFLLGIADAFRILEVVYWIAGRVELDALVATGKKPCAPLSRCNRLWVSSSDTGENDKAWQFFCFAPQTVSDPGTH